MAKYRKASEKTISLGKGKSTDQLSLADAKEYFNSRAKETGAKRFRWKGDVYDLSGNKVDESKGSGTRSPSLSRDEGPKRPKANPSRGPGGARPEPGKAGGLPAAKGAESPGKRGEVNPAVVGAMGAAAVGAGVAAARSGRGPAKANSTSISDRVRAAGAKAKSAAMGVPAKPPAKAATPTATASTPTTTKAPKGGAKGGARVGGAPVGRNLGRATRGGRVLQMPDVMSYQFMNKGGMVKKKK